jgi:hypothetical protein
LGRYALLVLGILGGSLALFWPTLLAGLPARGRWAACAGGGLAGLNTLLAHALVVWSQPRSTNSFLRAVLGGMVARMALMLAAVVGGVLVLGLPKVPLAVSLLSYFVLFLVLELAILQKQTTPEARVP